jgi:nitrite reductase (NADH) large subunit
MKKQRLVVIGNGMAGVRTVEEILARGGADQFEITIFGDEPYGNYNRILLSNVMNGSQEPEDIFLNAFPWYRERDIKLHVGVRVLHIDRVRKLVFGVHPVVEPYDKLIIATGSRAFIPPIEGLLREDGSLRPGAYGFRTLDDCRWR